MHIFFALQPWNDEIISGVSIVPLVQKFNRIKYYILYWAVQCAPCRKIHTKFLHLSILHVLIRWKISRIRFFFSFFFLRQSFFAAFLSSKKKSLFVYIMWENNKIKKLLFRIFFFLFKCVCCIEVLTYFYCILNEEKKEEVSSKNSHLYSIVWVCIFFYYHVKQQHFHCFTGIQHIVALCHVVYYLVCIVYADCAHSTELIFTCVCI